MGDESWHRKTQPARQTNRERKEGREGRKNKDVPVSYQTLSSPTTGMFSFCNNHSLSVKCEIHLDPRVVKACCKAGSRGQRSGSFLDDDARHRNASRDFVRKCPGMALHDYQRNILSVSTVSADLGCST